MRGRRLGRAGFVGLLASLAAVSTAWACGQPIWPPGGEVPTGVGYGSPCRGTQYSTQGGNPSFGYYKIAYGSTMSCNVPVTITCDDGLYNVFAARFAYDVKLSQPGQCNINDTTTDAYVVGSPYDHAYSFQIDLTPNAGFYWVSNTNACTVTSQTHASCRWDMDETVGGGGVINFS
jgi:hypothetical protein